MRDENNNRKEGGTHLKWKKHIAGSEGIGLIRVRLPRSGDRSKSIKCEREITKKEGCPRPSLSGQVITEPTLLSSFLSLRKKENSHAKEWRNIFQLH